MSKFDRSRFSLLSVAFGGTAIQALTDSAPIAAALGAGACAWFPPLAIVAGAAAGLALNRVAAALDRQKELSDATRDLLTNRDIALAQAQAIAARLRQCAETCGKAGLGVERRRLLALAEAAPEWWLPIVADPSRKELSALRDEDIVNQLTPYLTGERRMIPDEPLWRELLAAADRHAKGEPKLDAAAVAMLARRLATEFPQDFVEALKTDFQQGGKAYAAVTLRFFGEILGGVRSIAGGQAELQPLLKQLPELLETTRQAIATLRSAGLPSNLDTLLASTETRLTGEIRTLRREMHARFDALEKKVGELRAHLIARGIEPMDLTREELERELATRIPGLTAQEVHRLVDAARFRADLSRIFKYAPAELIGRADELTLLDDAWLKVRHAELPRAHVVTFVALGGEGKTSLVAKWCAELAGHDWPGCDAAFAWSFYSQGTREQVAASSDLFLNSALSFFGDDAVKQFAASSAARLRKANASPATSASGAASSSSTASSRCNTRPPRPRRASSRTRASPRC